MKTFIQATLVMSLVSIGIAISYADTNVSNYQQNFRAYVNVGNNTVALPSRLRVGDEIVLTSVNGARVYDKKVNEGVFYLNPRNFNPGLYVLHVLRNGATIASVRVPLSEK